MTPYVVIAGPTAVGKTELSACVAEALGGEILSIDSRQLYRGLDIGTAKPTAAEQAAVRHHLLDITDPDTTVSAGQFARQATEAWHDVVRRGGVPILVGGSGLYLSAILDGLFDEEAPSRRNQRARWSQRLAEDGVDALWDDLGRLDPAAQKILHPNDQVRILRALELASDGSRSARWEQHHRPGIGADCAVLVCLSRQRQSLTRRIDERVDTMWDSGWVEEIQQLLRQGVAPDAPGLQCLGYAEVMACIGGTASREDAIEQIRRRTRQYAKRQVTWFRRDRRFRWIDVDRLDTEAVVERIEGQFRRVQTGACHIDSST